MINPALVETIQQLFAGGKGLLAMDESNPTCNRRFEAAGIPQTIEMRRSYRELIVTTPGLQQSIGGAILYDETIRQQTQSGTPFVDALVQKGIITGIKVDKGARPMAGFEGEKITDGLDGLRERLAEYKKMGARFAKWRAVIKIAENIPSSACIEGNMHALTRYAALCQEAGIVPIVEPEVLMAGDHSLQKCFDVTSGVLKLLFYQMYRSKIVAEAVILKPNMIIQGIESKEKNSVCDVAAATVTCLLQSVPAAVPAIAFLSGGQSPDDASAHLNSIHNQFHHHLPWIVSFSFARAIQQPALEMWKGEDANAAMAQKILSGLAEQDVEANKGQYQTQLK